MNDLAISAGIFAMSLFVLMKASDYFMNSAESVGKKLGMPALVIGVLIVSVASSLPEMLVSIIAVQAGNSEIVIGNVIGSNITNILLVLGATAIAAKGIKSHATISFIHLILVMGTILLAITIIDGEFDLIESVLFVLILIGYTIITLKREKKHRHKEVEANVKSIHDPTIFTYLILAGSSAAIYFSAEFAIESIVNISQILGIATDILAVSAVALGTSLPELVISVSAALKGKLEIAVGNVIGSNIFNIFAVMGIAGLFGNLEISQSAISFSLPVMILSTLIYFVFIQGKRITPKEGSVMVLLYCLFILKLYNVY